MPQIPAQKIAATASSTPIRKTELVSRRASTGARPASVSHWKAELIGSFRAPSWAPSKVVAPIATRTRASEPGCDAQRVAPASQGRRPGSSSRRSNGDSEANMPKYWVKVSPRSIQRSIPNSAMQANV